MDLIRFSIKNPVTVIVGVLILVLFGIISLRKLPIQLAPSVEEPVIAVTTTWPGATPYEIERDIVEEQEKVLKGIPGLYEMESSSLNGMGTVTLRFKIGTDINEALLRVSNKLDEVPTYPENVDKPILNAAGAESPPVIWIMLKTLEGNDRPVWSYYTFFEEELMQYLERVDGVADLFVRGGAPTEMHVSVSPEKLASYQLTIQDVLNALRSGNANISAGNLEVGRHDNRIRSVAEFRSPEEILDVVLKSDGEREVLLGDTATVDFGYKKMDTPVISRYDAGIAIGVRMEPYTNILNLTDQVEQVVNELNEGLLKENGLWMQIVSERRPYIRGAIGLLKQNIFLGGSLAIFVLLVFLRSIAPTIVAGAAIPISIIGTFLALLAMGSTLNVVSLAGIAFAVGMLVDNAIVVLENIDRHKGMGKTPFAATYDGTKEVWGAVLASSVTTVAVFLPVIFLEDEAGQLFRDIALATSVSVTLSLIVSVTVIPTFSKKLYTMADTRNMKGIKKWTKPLARLGTFLADLMMGIVHWGIRNTFTRLATAVILTGGALFTIWALAPKMEYLPQGNRDLIINVLIPPPGLSYEERKQIGEDLFEEFLPYYEKSKDGLPPVAHMFYVGSQQSMIFGVVSGDQQRTTELIPLCKEKVSAIPGVFGITNQANIFQAGIGEGRSVSVDFSGPDLEAIVRAAGAGMGKIRERIAGVQVRPLPSLDMLFPEANFIPHRDHLRSVGMTAEEFGIALDVMMDGRDIGDFKEEGRKKIDLILKVADTEVRTPEELHEALVVTPLGRTVQTASLAELEKTTGLSEIRHLERDRTVTLQVSPPYETTIQETMEIVESEVVSDLRERGLLDGIRVGLSGTADKLTDTRQALQWNFVVAALLSYLLMSALLGNFLYPLIIMFTVPLAAAGGFVGLKLLNVFIVAQQMDILTMLGFVILIGVVVNNAILIVYQALQNVRQDGMDPMEAVLDSTRTRLRPIYMSAMTSIIGMVPLVLWPGPGSELYRGLGSVILGGLAASTVFTVFLIPALLMFLIQYEKPAGPEEV